MSVAVEHSQGKLTKTETVLLSSQFNTWTSDGAPNATEQVGRVLDRLGEGRVYLAAKLAVGVTTQTTSTGGAATTIATVITRMLHCTASGGSFTAFGSTGVQTTIQSSTTTATSTAYHATHEVAYDLTQANRFIQVGVLVNAVASSSGWTKISPVLTFMSPSEAPAAGTILTGTSTSAYTSTSAIAAT